MRFQNAVLGLLAALCVFAPGASAALPQQGGGVDLLNQGFAQWDGPREDARAGAGVAALGDVNGDGRSDVAIGSPAARNAANQAEAGVVYVDFAPRAGSTDLVSFGNRGLRIEGGEQFFVGEGVDAAGDVNADGLSDIVITTREGCAGASNSAAYVIFGRRAPGVVNVESLGTAGFRVCAPAVANGITAGAGIGDVNGDRRADLVFGVPDEAGGAGAAYVVFGSGSSADVDLTALGDRGYRMGGAPGDTAGISVAGAGDVNGDRRGDVVVGASMADTPGGTDSGLAYVVFGKGDTAPVNLGALLGGGYRIVGGAQDDFAGAAVAGAGDVNRDGRPDVVVGSPGTDRDGVTDAGAAYVVFGKAGTIEVTLGPPLGSGGYAIRGSAGGTAFGAALAGVGDVNGDELPDVAVGAPRASPLGRAQAGSVYVTYGRRSGPVDTAASPAAYRGYRVDGAAAGDQLGGNVLSVTADSVDGGTDVNGDARPDVLLGSEAADNNGRTGSGSAYAVLGFGTPGVAYDTLRTRVGASVVHGPRVVRRTGTATFAPEGSLPAGLSLDRATGVIRGTPTSGTPERTFGVRISDAAGSAIGLFRIHVASAPRAPACRNRIRGTNRRNTLRGTALGDNILGLRGNDRLFGSGGDDCLTGGKGNDRLSAGPGKDRLKGDSGNDTLLGSSGNDTVNGGSGKDRANGGTGRDTYTLGSGNDRVTTADGVAERVNCGSGRDRVVAADRGDRLRGCERVRRN